jgi:hypothetical protein
MSYRLLLAAAFLLVLGSLAGMVLVGQAWIVAAVLLAASGACATGSMLCGDGHWVARAAALFVLSMDAVLLTLSAMAISRP